jgi:hypothetical protein
VRTSWDTRLAGSIRASLPDSRRSAATTVAQSPLERAAKTLGLGARRDTIAVSRPTPDVDVDRNQFAGAKRATIRVLRTTGFNEDVIAEDTIDLK